MKRVDVEVGAVEDDLSEFGEGQEQFGWTDEMAQPVEWADSEERVSLEAVGALVV